MIISNIIYSTSRTSATPAVTRARMLECTGTWHCCSPASLFRQSHSVHSCKSCPKITLSHPTLTGIPKHTSFQDFRNSCLFLGNVAIAQCVPHFWDTSVFLSMSEYTIQLEGICTNKSIQNFLEASSILSNTHHLCITHALKSQKNLGGIWRGRLVQTLTQSKVSYRSWCITTTTVLRALPSPGLHAFGDSDSAKSLSNLFQCFNHIYHEKFVFPDTHLEFPLLQLVFCILSFCGPSLRTISVSSTPLTPPLQKLPGSSFWDHCSWVLYISIAKLFIKNDKQWEISGQKRGRHIRK